MNRLKAVLKQRKLQVLLTLGALLLAISVAVASGANFTASSANAGNAFTAGTLTMSNNDAPGAIFLSTPAKMRPGAVSTGTVTVANTGDVPGQFSMSATATSDPNNLGANLNLLIMEGGTTIYTGKLNAVGTLALGTWQSTGGTSSHTYAFTVTWPNNSPSSDATDTSLMGKACTYAVNWAAIANSTIN